MKQEHIELLAEYFGHGYFSELEIGDRIKIGDVFIQYGKVHPASDIGNGIYSPEHFFHYREHDDLNQPD